MFLFIFRESGGQMTVGFVFWLLMLLWLVIGIMWYRKIPDANYYVAGGNVLIFILLCLLGWGVFGFPISG